MPCAACYHCPACQGLLPPHRWESTAGADGSFCMYFEATAAGAYAPRLVVAGHRVQAVQAPHSPALLQARPAHRCSGMLLSCMGECYMHA